MAVLQLTEPEGITIKVKLTVEESLRFLDREVIYKDGDGLRIMIVLDEKGLQRFKEAVEQYYELYPDRYRA